MSKRNRSIACSCLFVALLNLAAPTVLAADPSECADWAQGEQTGQYYQLETQFTRSVTTTVTVEAGVCSAGASMTESTTDTFNVGTYRNTTTGARVQVNCSTGQVLGR